MAVPQGSVGTIQSWIWLVCKRGASPPSRTIRFSRTSPTGPARCCARRPPSARTRSSDYAPSAESTSARYLEGLRPADLASARARGRVVRHVLRLERSDADPAPPRRPAEPGHDHRLPDVRTRALDHERARHQPAPARQSERNSVIRTGFRSSPSVGGARPFRQLSSLPYGTSTSRLSHAPGRSCFREVRAPGKSLIPDRSLCLIGLAIEPENAIILAQSPVPRRGGHAPKVESGRVYLPPAKTVLVAAPVACSLGDG